MSDKKLYDQTSGTYSAQVVSATDYYPFGMAMPDRTYSSSNYRFGFNSQEKSDIAEGHTTAEFWEYSSRTARRWNVDPRPNTSLGRYTVLGLSPIYFKDMRGDTIEDPDGDVLLVEQDVKLRIEEVEKQINSLEETIDNIKKKGRKARVKENKLSERKRELQQLQGVLVEIDVLRKSKNIYHVRKLSLDGITGGYIRYIPGTSGRHFELAVALGSPDYLSYLAHELKHAYQYEMFKMSFNYSHGNAGLLYDLQDEVEAYNRQKLIYGDFMDETIDYNFVLARGYDDIKDRKTQIEAPPGSNSNRQLYWTNYKQGYYSRPILDLFNGSIPAYDTGNLQFGFDNGFVGRR